MTAEPGLNEVVAKAIEAERLRDFHAAYGYFLQAHFRAWGTEPREADAVEWLFRASLCLQKSQDWRGDAALWEYLGDVTGQQLGDDPVLRESPGQSGMFNLISLDQWSDPYEGYYDDDTEASRHRQAWAYLFAADSSRTAGQHEQAVRAYRKSAICWELSAWGQRPPPRRPTRPASSAEHRIAHDPTEKWRLAARCYFLAALATIQSIEPRVRDHLFAQYGLDKVRWRESEQMASSEAARPANDIERFERCWDEARRVSSSSEAKRECLSREVEMLRILEAALVMTGRRPEARDLFRWRQQLVGKREAHRGTRWLRALFHHTTGSGSSVARTLVTAALLYVVVFPAILLASGLLVPVPAGGTVTVVDAVLFSLGSAVGLDPKAADISGDAGSALQIALSVSAYFVLGYVVWLILRWYGE